MVHSADPAIHLRQAAGQLKSAVTYIEHVAIDGGVPVPLEVLKAAAVVRQWCRSVGATDPAPSRVQELLAHPTRPARLRQRGQLRRTRR